MLQVVWFEACAALIAQNIQTIMKSPGIAERAVLEFEQSRAEPFFQSRFPAPGGQSGTSTNLSLTANRCPGYIHEKVF